MDFKRYSDMSAAREALCAMSDMEVRAILLEREACLDRLIESEEVGVREDGLPYWTSCGEWVGNG